MARDLGAVYAEALTGFKWIADAARKGEAAGQVFVFGYEEALGYTVSALVRDKDGIGAALRLAELARVLKARGSTLLDRIDEILVAHGMSHQLQWSITLAGTDGKARIRRGHGRAAQGPAPRPGCLPGGSHGGPVGPRAPRRRPGLPRRGRGRLTAAPAGPNPR
jgi:phosphomannomutase